ncbi:unnamed protein product [Rhizophagus irregularis]|nr:unnamed protein product [Rhizophagus irregularis]
MNDLVKEFAEIIADELNLIRNRSIIALKHVATGKYLSSIDNLRYTTGSKRQLAFAGSPEPDLNALWKIEFSGKLPIHDVQFTIGNDTFQEVVCHSERLGGNDEWRIELISQD